MKPLKEIGSILVTAAGAFGAAGVFNLLIVAHLVTIPPEMLREAAIFPLIIVCYFAIACVLWLIGTRSTFAIRPLRHWLIAGVVVWETAFGLSSLAIQAYYRFPIAAIPIDLVWYIVEGTVAGLLMFLFHRTANSPGH